MLFKHFYPKKYVRSVYFINFKRYYKQGFRGILFDIDNTLVPHGHRAEEKTIHFFKKLKAMGFKVCLISNNNEKRVVPFAKEVDAPFIFDAHKPSLKSYNEAMEKMGTDVNETIFVGDQVFTDVFGANRANMYTILVKPIHPKEEIQIVIKRYLEKFVMLRYSKRNRKKVRTEKKQFNKKRVTALRLKKHKI